MQGNIRHFFSQYSQWMVQQYHLISKIQATIPPLKIVSENFSTERNLVIFTVQISGKNICPKFTANELYKDKKIFLQFSEADQKQIVAALPFQHTLISYRIAARTFDSKTKQFTFTIEFIATNKKIVLTAIDVITQFQDLQGFSQQDAFLLGVEIGREFESKECHD